jgi:glycosyltransferase involved in cell wall biosynthesis
VLGQEGANVELIVVDGGSTDGTLDVLREFDGDARFSWTSEPDTGQSNAINKGWRRSTGTVLSWLCADDGLYPGAVAEVAKELRAHPEAGLVYGRGTAVDLEGNVTHTTPLGERDADTLVDVQNFICQPAAFASREAVEAVGFVDESLHYAMDWDLFIRIARIRPIVHTPRVLAWTRIYDDTKSSTGGRRRFHEILGVLREHSDRRYPPAYFLHRTNEVRRVARASIDKLPPALARRSNRIVDRALRPAYAAVHRRTGVNRGWYPDGWAAPEVEWSFLASDRTLHVHGTVPAEYAELHGQEIAVHSDGIEVARVPVGPGDFELDVPLPGEERAGRRARHIRLLAQRSFVPRKARINKDRRRLAYRLHDLDAR